MNFFKFLSHILLISCLEMPNVFALTKEDYSPSSDEKKQIKESISNWLSTELANNKWQVANLGLVADSLKNYKGKEVIFQKNDSPQIISCIKWDEKSITCKTKTKIILKSDNNDLDVEVEQGASLKDGVFKEDIAKAFPYNSLKKVGIVKKEEATQSSKRSTFKYDIQLTTSKSNSLETKDYKIDFSFNQPVDGIKIELQNKSKNEIKIDWNESNIVDFDKNAQKVTHNEVKFLDASSPKTPTIIPPSAKISDLIVSSNKIAFIKSWYIVPMLPFKSSSGTIEIDEQLNMGDGNAFKDKSFILWLSLDINGKKVKKDFIFKVNSVQENQE